MGSALQKSYLKCCLLIEYKGANKQFYSVLCIGLSGWNTVTNILGGGVYIYESVGSSENRANYYGMA